MTKKQRYEAVLDYFQKSMPAPETELLFSNPYELTVAVILSAQCTDKRVNMVTQDFFITFPTIHSLANVSADEIFPYIKSISYPNNKAKHLEGMAKMVVKDYNSEIPMTVAELMKLPGVGRKTANVITSVIDQQPNMAVDTHVFRVAARIGLTTNAKTPLAAELQLIKYIPKSLVYLAHHWLILHGRYVCIARNPKCHECQLTHLCKYFQSQKKKAK